MRLLKGHYTLQNMFDGMQWSAAASNTLATVTGLWLFHFTVHRVSLPWKMIGNLQLPTKWFLMPSASQATDEGG